MTPVEQGAREVCNVLRTGGFRALLAGGCVRDKLLGRSPEDFDIAADAHPEDVIALFPKTVAVGASFGVVLVLWKGERYEVATFRADGPYLDGRRPSSVTYTDPEHDAQRRDFTINALFLDPETDQVIDYVGGQQDLEVGVVRAVGDPYRRFEEDHLRLLRAVRFTARFDYELESQTRDAVLALHSKIHGTSAERIRDELVKMLCEGHARRAFELLHETRLLHEVLPEVAAMEGVEQPAAFHPEGDVWTHTLIMLDQLQNPTPTLAMGVLLHDVGKPVTQTFEDRIRFNNHDHVGADMARDICHRLRFSKKDTEQIVWLVDQHMRLATLPDMKESKRRRFVREEGFSELVALGRIDCLGSHGMLDTVDWIEDYRANLKPEQTRPPALVTGNDLITMGYKPGPLFKEILSAVEDAQLEGKLETPEAARAFIRATWKSDIE
jgi:poly(A) polymerase